ncbi:acyl-CoA dehydrogenase family protein [Ensifer adhaerens]|uniref:acyl-CoA dehydrogenase family protein n=1 Tax=Ensifer adhaerens TaxID=106592 RepID=UPI001CBB7B4F|nr:acyl-CoA dehydrogenase family protein [Ensifer adhaerens]MBZ7924334.1 acyl-CoA dehydrogenase family protein [Ensifer adhaerens]UAX96417.1 acyl-CoA dehydrogenase family protein [Ensifer adhaerens]UAY04240.1 acyl-CoA dehydrogenase family protein [Ensifer adhaerens]UAY12226.1 acyl-CoA dehydrogenase family protein [Ensifer adhaerens]
MTENPETETAGRVKRLEAAVEALVRRIEPAILRAREKQASTEGLGQAESHGLAWFATYASALRAIVQYGLALERCTRLTEIESLLIAIGGGEYLDQVLGGIPMSQSEFARTRDLLSPDMFEALLADDDIRNAIQHGNTPANRSRLVTIWREANTDPHLGDPATDDTVEAIRLEMRKFVANEISPHAHFWHLNNSYIPQDVLDQLGALGVFGLTLPEEYGGSGLSKVAMCVVTEELSKGYLGVGSLGTRSEIAAELISSGGTEEQKRKWLPLIASGACVPTAVFTEPDVGSDLASLKTRASLKDGFYEVTGAKSWITHAGRANLMTLLVRTDPDDKGYRGLSLLLAEKTAGTVDAHFRDEGLSGSEIEVLGYRGMKEFELSFDAFRVPMANLLGEREGQGFKQLMRTFEAARIQTAARAVGVAEAAFSLSWRYATDRVQFGQPIVRFDRISDKLAMMAAEILICRQLVYASARQKDANIRCDVEAGMAKLLAARVAWACADSCVQIHGGNGFALEFEASRLLCDARILSIFEGAAEIQADIISRGLLSTK